MFDRFGSVCFTPHSKVDEFVRRLAQGQLVASQCARCARRSFPPRADCADCLSDEFSYVEISGRGTLVAHTTIYAAPSGFEASAPYTLAVVELAGGARAMAGLGESLRGEELQPGLPIVLVPRRRGEGEALRIDYILERDEEEDGS